MAATTARKNIMLLMMASRMLVMAPSAGTTTDTAPATSPTLQPSFG